MNLSKAAAFSAILGLTISSVFVVGWELVLAVPHTSENIFHYVQMRMAFWPSSILLMAIGASPRWSISSIVIVLISASINASLYAVLGSLIWLGLRKSLAFLIVAATAIAGFVWAASNV
jgi:hypothetical protein